MGVPQLPKRVRYNGPYSMSLDRPGEFGLALLTNVAYWEVPRLAVGLLMRWRYGGKRAKDTKDKEFVACAVIPKPYTLNPKTLNPQPSTLNPNPLNPEP